MPLRGFVLPLFCAAVCAGAQPPSPASLRGLEGFRIVVEPIAAEAREAGLTPELLRKDAELRLQAGGVPALAGPASRDDAVVSIAVSTAKGERGDYAFHIALRVLQRAALARSAEIVLPAIATWELEYLDNVGPPAEKMPGWVRPILANMLDRLIGDYRAANR